MTSDYDRDKALRETIQSNAEMISFRLRIIKASISDLLTRPDFVTNAEDAILFASNLAHSWGNELREAYDAFRAKPVSE